MKPRLLITGISGFVGNHLQEQLQRNHRYEVFGTALEVPSNIGHAHIFAGDLKNLAFAKKVIGEVNPEYVIHLAAQSSVAQSLKDPHQTLEDNFSIQLNVLEALRESQNLKKLLIISSSDVYGDVAVNDLPITETQALAPTSPYAVSKVLQEELGRGYFSVSGLPCVILRPFNHIGPNQANKTAIASFIEKIRQAKNGEEILVGNLQVKRDLSDVRDMVQAYLLALERAIPGETYNIGAGKSYLLSDMLDQLVTLSGKELKITIDKKLLRPHDIMETRCDYSKFHKLTGWKLEISISQTLKDMCNSK